MDILTNYENKIKELSDELVHCISEYNKLILKRNKIEEKNTVNIKKKKKEKSYQKRN